ncbi:uncharacterized protein LOC125025367 isoform X5 [Penaeus chinensis]|uniref:uncharacterized protein LOC125025367 isoform X5 n=1 Tax=Penaeus chinensis TaxID=139456 RepID=UPI001FB7653D|nr:uncharacterized protein LOC125025367 isoform X5 [Penaeus chinensis]
MGTLPRAPIDQCSFGVGFRVSLICVAIGAALFTYRCHRITYMRPTVSAIGSITMDDAVGFQRTHIRPIDGGNANSGSLEAGTIQYRNLNINMTASSQQLWPNDTQCDRLTVRPGRGISQTWLLSFPRSGNTWTRYLVEAATGVFTTSVYHDKLLVRLGFQGEREGVDAGTTLLQKTHDTRWISNTSQPVILLIRDPQRAITSFWSWMQLSGDPDGIPLIRLGQDAGVEPHDRQSCRKIRKPNDPVLRGPSEGSAEGTPTDPSLPEGQAGRRATRVLG